MTDNVYVNRDRTKVVPAGSADAKWQMSRKEADALGLLDSSDSADKPASGTELQTQRTAPKRKTTKKA